MPSLNSIAVGTAGRMLWDLIIPCQSGCYRSPSCLFYVFFVSFRPTIPVPWWLVRHLPRNLQEWGKFATLLVVCMLKSYQLQVALLPAPGPCWEQSPRAPIIGLRSTLAIFSQKWSSLLKAWIRNCVYWAYFPNTSSFLWITLVLKITQWDKLQAVDW